MKQEVFLPDDYRPAEDEPFMNERQLEYFRRKLLNWKEELLSDSRDTIEGLQDNTRQHPRCCRPRQRRDRPRAGAAHAGSPAQAGCQDRRRAAPYRRR